MKKLLSFLLALALVFSVSACRSVDDVSDESRRKSSPSSSSSVSNPLEDGFVNDDPENNGSTPILYKATDKDGNVVWIFGSVHYGTDWIYPLPNYVMDAFNGSDALAVEFDVVEFSGDVAAQTKALQKLVYTDGTTIEDHISPSLYERAFDILNANGYGVYIESTFDYFSPYYWQNIISSFAQQGLSGGLTTGVDVTLINDAKSQNKEILDIESADLQYELIAGFSDEILEMMLESAVTCYEDSDAAKAYQDGITNLIKTWASGSPKAISEAVKADKAMFGERTDLFTEYYTKLFTNRNVTMADFAEDALKSGKEVFICVGAGHVVGNDGIAGLLLKRGYKIELIRPNTISDELDAVA